jgi:hypothetical protein
LTAGIFHRSNVHTVVSWLQPEHIYKETSHWPQRPTYSNSKPVLIPPVYQTLHCKLWRQTGVLLEYYVEFSPGFIAGTRRISRPTDVAARERKLWLTTACPHLRKKRGQARMWCGAINNRLLAATNSLAKGFVPASRTIRHSLMGGSDGGRTSSWRRYMYSEF